MGLVYARIGAISYGVWGAFHLYVAYQIYALALTEQGLSQGRLFQLAAYMLTISLFVLVVALTRNWRNDATGYWLNLAVASWADVIWILIVVLPGYVPAARGLIPPAFWVLGALFTTLAYRTGRRA